MILGEQERILQALIIADDFSGYLAPLVPTIPAALLPIGNSTVLGFMLEHLRTCGFSQVFIISQDINQSSLDAYLAENRWIDHESDFEVVVTYKQGIRNTAEALRSVDKEFDLQSEFLLIDGPCLFNLDLEQAFQHHRARAKGFEPNYTLTMICRPSSSTDPCRGVHDPPVMIRDPATGFLHMYDLDHEETTVTVPLSLFKAGSSVVPGSPILHLTSDIVCTNMYIASSAFLGYCTGFSMFDHSSLYSIIRSMIEARLAGDGIVTEIVGNVIIDGSDATFLPIDCLRNYKNACLSWIKRNMFPYVPEGSGAGNNAQFAFPGSDSNSNSFSQTIRLPQRPPPTGGLEALTVGGNSSLSSVYSLVYQSTSLFNRETLLSSYVPPSLQASRCTIGLNDDLCSMPSSQSNLVVPSSTRTRNKLSSNGGLIVNTAWFGKETKISNCPISVWSAAHEISNPWTLVTVIKNSILGDKSSIGVGSVLTDSIVMHDCKIGCNAIVRGCILMDECVLEDGVDLCEGCVVGPKTHIPQGYKQTEPVYLCQDAIKYDEIMSPLSRQNLAQVLDTIISGSVSFDSEVSTEETGTTATPGSPWSLRTPPDPSSPRLGPLETRTIYMDEQALIETHGVAGRSDVILGGSTQTYGEMISRELVNRTLHQSSGTLEAPNQASIPPVPVSPRRKVTSTNRIEYVYLCPPTWGDTGIDVLWTINAAEDAEKQEEDAVEKDFKSEISHILMTALAQTGKDVFGCMRTNRDILEQIRLNLQNSRIQANMEHQDCMSAIVEVCLSYALTQATNAVKQCREENSESPENPAVAKFGAVFPMEALRSISAIWPVLNLYIPDELREEDENGVVGYQKEILFIVQVFVDEQMCVHHSQPGAKKKIILDPSAKLIREVPGISREHLTAAIQNLFFGFFSKKSQVFSISGEALCAFFEELREDRSPEYDAFLSLIANFVQWMEGEEEEDEEGEDEEDYGEDGEEEDDEEEEEENTEE